MNNWIRSAGFACGLAVLPILLAAAQSPSLAPPVDFEPTAAHPRSSEGSFATLRSGRIIFCYSQFYGGGRDDSPSAVARIYSDDGGRSWTKPEIIVPTGDNRNLMSVSLLRLASGKIALFYLAKKNGWLDCRPYMRVSADEGQTWGPAALVVKVARRMSRRRGIRRRIRLVPWSGLRVPETTPGAARN